MKRTLLVVVVLAFLFSAFPARALTYSYQAFCAVCQKAISPSASCGSSAYNGPTTSYPEGYCRYNNANYTIAKQTNCTGAASYKQGSLFPKVEGNTAGVWCVTSCPSGTTLVTQDNGGTLCATDCPAGYEHDTWGTCQLIPCQQGQYFLGLGSDTGPQCLSGCGYAASGETRYTQNPIGEPVVLSRWVSTGSSCSGGDTLDPADASGCPNEVAEDLRPLLCGLPSPCAEGEFLFQGNCVADTTESGCVLIDGEQVCAEAEQNCVVINGERVCVEQPTPENLETYKENGCVWSFGQAAWVCPTDTATKTTTGTTTTTTDPVTGNKTSTTVTTAHNNVTGGTTTTTTTVVTDADGNELSRDVSEKTTGLGADGGTLVAREPEALGEKPDLDWLRTAQEVKDNLSSQWEAVPLVAAVSSFSNLQLTGAQPACPEFCLPFWGETLCTTKHCEIWATISFVISGVLLALYGMTAIRIVLSA